MNRKEAIEIIKNSNIYGARMNGKNLIIEAINELVKDITLLDFLGWEEGVEYEYKCTTCKIENNKILYKSNKCSSGWCNLYICGDDVEELQQAKKVEPKLKAYHVTDKYSKEEPKFYAKIKGWELYSDNDYYWKYYIENELFADYKYENELYKTKFTKTEWNELGINDTNADFEEIEE